ncbi:MAG: cobalt chelatase [Gammaproteobacteria bacterium]|nr:cobalt chelatase [Gammaproteobacteria bacterium]
MKTERQQQRVEELCGACIRALTGQHDLRYRGRRLHKGLRPVPLGAAHLRTDPERDDFKSYRGAADGLALRLQYSDSELHHRLLPERAVQRFVFELMEQLRVESLVPGQLPGMKRNLHYRFTQWCLAFYQSRLTENQTGILIYTLAQLTWSRLGNYPVLEETEDVIEATRFHLTPLIGHQLAALRRTREDQLTYSQHALSIARTMDQLLAGQSASESEQQESDHDEAAPSDLSRFLDLESDGELEAMTVAGVGESKVFREAPSGYRVFTTKHDREVSAVSLVREAYLKTLRLKLDALIRGQGINIPRLARRLSMLLADTRLTDWKDGEEEGYVDGRRLSRLVTAPGERRLFRRQAHRLQADCLVSILIDCSGSMKNQIEPVAILVDVLSRALEQAGVNSEILGHTTGAWNGGKCQREWMSLGRPSHPGRLNELCHVVYKAADNSWRRARSGIGALLKPDLFREGIDGEAVEWACWRMIGRPEKRRTLIVISDGCPMDTATGLANDKHYLDNHLKQVTARLEQSRDIELYGLGVGLDLSAFYTNSLALDLSKALSNQVFDEILQLLAGRHHR